MLTLFGFAAPASLVCPSADAATGKLLEAARHCAWKARMP
jgi:hypothetical protein